MQSPLEQIRQELQFISHTVSNGFMDFDTLDELEQSAATALRALKELEPQPPLTVDANIQPITSFEQDA